MNEVSFAVSAMHSGERLDKILSVEIDELSTVEYTYNAIANVFDEKDKKGEKIKYYVAYEGFVSAGIDFKKIEIQVNEAEKVVTVVLPEIEVHSTTVEMGSLDCIFVKENPQIFRKCTSLKHTFFEKVLQPISQTERSDRRKNGISKTKGEYGDFCK